MTSIHEAPATNFMVFTERIHPARSIATSPHARPKWSRPPARPAIMWLGRACPKTRCWAADVSSAPPSHVYSTASANFSGTLAHVPARTAI